jgi:very-short-patch-repair endonuclease
MTKRIEEQTQFRPKSQLEQDFAELLEGLGIVFEEQKNIKDSLFDFYIPSKNLLIEVDGDFYHVNPAVHVEKYPVQRNTLINDARKNKLAEREGFHLERFWENDIRKNLPAVLSRLKYLTT